MLRFSNNSVLYNDRILVEIIKKVAKTKTGGTHGN